MGDDMMMDDRYPDADTDHSQTDSCFSSWPNTMATMAMVAAACSRLRKTGNVLAAGAGGGIGPSYTFGGGTSRRGRMEVSRGKPEGK